MTATRLARLAGPLVVAAVAVAFAGRVASQPPGPDEAVVALAVADSCSVVTLHEMQLLADARFKDLQVDPQGPWSVCAYLGMGGTDTDLVEVAVASSASLRREAEQDAGEAFAAAVAAAGDAATPVLGLGHEAAHLDVGTGELWVRAGDALLRVAVVREGPLGDSEAAAVVARGVLAKLGAAG